MHAANDDGDRGFSLVVHIRGMPNADYALPVDDNVAAARRHRTAILGSHSASFLRSEKRFDAWPRGCSPRVPRAGAGRTASCGWDEGVPARSALTAQADARGGADRRRWAV